MKIYRLGIVSACLSLLFFLFANQWLSVTDPVESNYALTAKEMVMSGDWLSPQIYHQYWFDKPIMIYWLVALSYKIFGITDFAARLPGALFSAMSVGLLYQFVRMISGRKLLALWSAFILATTLEFWIIAHGIVTDAVLMWATVGTVGAAYLGLERNRKSYIALAYAFAGVAVLTKGPVGIVLPGILLLVFSCIMGARTFLPRLFPWQGLLVFALVALPWYGYMYWLHGQDFINGFLGLHNYVRATVSEHAEDNKWYYYLVLMPLAMLPWTGVSFYEMWKGRSRKFFYVYLMTWGWGTILFYTFMATKYPTYTFIALIPFSVLAAMGTIRLLHHKKRQYWFILTGPALLLWSALAIASLYVKWGFWLPLYVVVTIGALTVFYLHLKGKKYVLPLTIMLGTMLVSMVVIYEGIVPLTHMRSTSDISSQVAAFKGDTYLFGDYKTSLVYYSGKDIPLIARSQSVKLDDAWAGKYTMPRIEENDIEERIKQGEEIMIVTNVKHAETIKQTAFYPYLEEIPSQSAGQFILYKTRGES